MEDARIHLLVLELGVSRMNTMMLARRSQAEEGGLLKEELFC